MNKTIDCILCGSCGADLLIRPVPLQAAIGNGTVIATDPIRLMTGGLACNAGIGMSRLGMKTAILAYVGTDEWGAMIRTRLEAGGVDCHGLLSHPTAGTSNTAVLISSGGERSFAHSGSASYRLDRKAMLAHLELFARSRMMLVGYYSQMPDLEGDLHDVLTAIRATGCQTAMDTGGSGGLMQPLDRILPHLDVYVPSRDEAMHQTGQSDPRSIIETFRSCGATGLLGVKLGSEGALLSPVAGEFVVVPCIKPPGPIIDTTGAGDAFLAGLLTGLLRGMSVADAGYLGAATAACCITALGATDGIAHDRVIDLMESARGLGVAVSSAQR
jgi:sugar/nucleoside kinase (ribokinase family)